MLATLSELTVESRDGDWGGANESEGARRFALIRGTDFGAVSLRQVVSVPRRFLPDRTSARRTLTAGDILIETAGGSPKSPTGRTMLVTQEILDCFAEPVSCASFARFIRLDRTKVHPGYMQRALQYLYRSGVLETFQVQHTGVARFQYTTFSTAHRFQLPRLAEQQAIAEVLGALDDKIAANTTLLTTSASLARAEMRAAMRVGATPYSISEVALLVSRGITPLYVSDGTGVRVLNQKCVREQRVSLDPSRWTDVSKARSEKLLFKYDILVNSTGQGTLGRVARWSGNDEATVDSHITIVRPDPTKYEPVVFGQAILAAQNQIEALGEGSTGQTELSRVELGRIRIDLPSKDVANTLGANIRALIDLEDAILEENRTLAATRDALLPQLMSGKLRVRDAEVAASAVGV